ncbi:nematode resistance protein-like HSPRO2 [Ananas comosus]|uniref:Nematode resistance protein-like HSPRO2 n=2 Tax=Ananas comosus TaxID=4615 RepID=A0A6P5G6J9_ANACO|nr:nematode resistance protein-like HSPRO2 [Ananas comosus]
MLELDWKSKNMAAPEISFRSSSPSSSSSRISDEGKPSLCYSNSPQLIRDESAIAAYEHYFRLPELSKLWSCRDFPEWKDEPIVKPALQALEITFRFVSVALSDPRPYANHREWRRRLESLAARQIELVAALCEEEEEGGGAPVAGLSPSQGVLSRERSSQEVWKLPGASAVVSRTSEASLLPRLATWDKTEDAASAIAYQIEGQMRRCRFTLGLGEPNLAGKPALEYDLVVRPAELHALRRSPSESRAPRNRESEALVTIHQILESWLCAARELLSRVGRRIDGEQWEGAASDCWLLERTWKLLGEVEDLHLLTDPDDFLRLVKSQLAIRAGSGSDALCFRSAALVEAADASRELKRRVPWVLGVEVDPDGGPRLQEAAMRLLHSRRRGEGGNSGRIDLLQSFQAVEAAVRRFFFGYRQLIAGVMGSLEAGGNRSLFLPSESLDPLSQMFLEPPYFPSLDAAKTFLGDFWSKDASDTGCGCSSKTTAPRC